MQSNTPPTPFFGYYPGTVAVVTVRTPDGRRNAMSAGWHCALSSEPPLYGVAIAPQRATYDMVIAAGSFAVNFLPFERADWLSYLGTASAHDIDKFATFDIEATAGPETGNPILADAYLCYECVVRDRVATGDHDWFVGEVVALHHEPEAYDETRLFSAAVPAAMYLGRSTYLALGEEAERVSVPRLRA